MTIKPDYLTLNSLLQNSLFRIPNYQRAYSWLTKQRKELFEDIEKLAESVDVERHHFMSTIVCLRQSTVEEVGSEEFGVFEVVDGQQRLTTLIILLKAIAKNLEDQKEAEKLNELLVKDDRRLILLQTNHDNSYIFHDYLQDGRVPSQASLKFKADQNMAEAIKECEIFVIGWKNGVSSLLKVIKNRLDFIFYVLEEEAAVYTIFEVLNSRGLDVDWLDKCKSILMGTAFEKFEPDARVEHIEELHKIWTQIYATIGLDIVPGHEILNFTATLSIREPQSRIMSSEKSLEFFRDFCQENPKSIFKISQRFLDVATQLKQLYQNPRLKAVSDIIQARLLVLAIMMKSSLTEPEKKDILECWEKVTFRIYGLYRKDSRTKVGEYIRLAREIFRVYDFDDPQWDISMGDLTKDAIIEKIQSLGSDLPIEKAIEELRGAACYDVWSSEEIRYFFYRYEEHLAATQGTSIGEEVWIQIWNSSPSDTIEHIYPQHPRSNSIENIPVTNEDELYEHVNRLGNLMLLPPKVNSQASNKSFKDKKMIYRNNNNLKLMNEIIQKNDWNLKALEKREEKLLEWAKVTWA
jgi:uncharacterized protein with ParB-like and HNH nuclease domain